MRRFTASRITAAVLVLSPLSLRQDSLSSTLTIAGPAEPGTRLTMSGVVRDARGQSIGGATLHVYQADATGRYTPARPMDEPHARLNGRLRADTVGRFEIRTVRPGTYPMTVHVGGRDRHIPAHIHVDVSAPGRPERRFQLVFADDSLLHDPYWIDWARTLRQPVVAVQHTAAGDSATVVLTLE